MKQDLFALVALSAIVACAVRAVRHAHREAMKPRAKPVDLQRWESEGGGVPAAASSTPIPGTTRGG